MNKKIILPMLIMTAVAINFGYNVAEGAFSAQVALPNVNFSISDYQPAPPNVYVHNNGGRPYYIERDHRVYMEKKHHGKHYKPGKDHDNGHKNGHYKNH